MYIIRVFIYRIISVIKFLIYIYIYMLIFRERAVLVLCHCCRLHKCITDHEFALLLIDVWIVFSFAIRRTMSMDIFSYP